MALQGAMYVRFQLEIVLGPYFSLLWFVTGDSRRISSSPLFLLVS
jgi:hypothetical protein